MPLLSMMKLNEPVGSERPKLKDLYKHVTPCYAAQWEDIGVYLDIELGHLQTIKADHPGDTSGCCKDLWKKWLELDPNATWEKLFTAIDDCTAASSSTATGTFLINVVVYIHSSSLMWPDCYFLQDIYRLQYKCS